MDIEATRTFLEQLPGLQAAYIVHTFRCWRDTKDGGAEEVTVSILDRGPEARASRYTCEVTTADGRRASGNANDNVQVAIAVVHWENLDVPRR